MMPNDLINEIVFQLKETEENFIYETITPYCENILQMKISKAELKELLIKGMNYKEKEGKWIPYHVEGLNVKCSECGSKYEVPWHYCPNCGSHNNGE